VYYSIFPNHAETDKTGSLFLNTTSVHQFLWLAPGYLCMFFSLLLSPLNFWLV